MSVDIGEFSVINTAVEHLISIVPSKSLLMISVSDGAVVDVTVILYLNIGGVPWTLTLYVLNVMLLPDIVNPFWSSGVVVSAID